MLILKLLFTVVVGDRDTYIPFTHTGVMVDKDSLKVTGTLVTLMLCLKSGI